jgi:hypothetical protein
VSDFTADALMVSENGDIVPFSRMVGPVKRIVTRGNEEAKLVRGLDGKFITRAQYEADSAITALRTTEQPRPVAERIISEPPVKPITGATQPPLVIPPSVPLPPGVQQPVVDLSNAVRQATEYIDQGARLDGAVFGGEVTQHQLDLLTYFAQRDGTDHVGQLLAQAAATSPDGKIGYQQADALIQQLDKIGADGRVTASVRQLRFMLAYGATGEDIAKASKMTRDEASRFIDQLIGQAPIPDVDTSKYTTIAEFEAGRSTARNDVKVLSEREVSRGYRMGQVYGRDFLGELLNPPPGPIRQAGHLFNLNNIAPSAAQRRTLRGLQRLAEQGNTGLDFLRGVDLTKLSAQTASTHIKRALGDPIALMLRGATDVPTDVATSAEIRDVARAAEVVAAKDSAADYLDEFLPRVSTALDQPGFPRTAAAEGFGTMRGEGARALSRKGVAPLTPPAIQDVFIRNMTEHAGTLYEGPMREVAGAMLYAKVGGEPSLTSAEISFNRGMLGIIETARQNPDTAETERVVAMIRNAYHSNGDAVKAERTAQDAALKGADQVGREEIQRNVGLYRDQLPALTTELDRLRAMQAIATPGTASAKRIEQRLTFLTDQGKRIESYLSRYENVSTRKIAGLSPKMEAMEARLAEYRATFPDLPATPSIDAPLDEAAGAASDLDLVDGMMRGHVRSTEDASPFTLIPAEELPQEPIPPVWKEFTRKRTTGRTKLLNDMSDEQLVDLHSAMRDRVGINTSALSDLDTHLYKKGLPSITGDLDLLDRFVNRLQPGDELPNSISTAFERIYGHAPADAEALAIFHEDNANAFINYTFGGPEGTGITDDLAHNFDGSVRTYEDLRTRVVNLQNKGVKPNINGSDIERDLHKYMNQMSAVDNRYGGSDNVPRDTVLYKWDEATPALDRTHAGTVVQHYPERRMQQPIDASLAGQERDRVSRELSTTLQQLGVSDAHRAVAQAMMDRFALAAVENNPQHYGTPERFFRRVGIQQGESGLTFNVAETGHAHLYDVATLRYGGSFEGSPAGGGIIRLFDQQTPGETMRAFVHEFGHLITSVLNEQQIRDLEYLYGISNGEFTPTHREAIAKSFEAYIVNQKRPATLRGDLIAENPAAQNIFRIWRNALVDVWRSVKGYFGKEDLSPQMYRFWEETAGTGTGMYKGGEYTSRVAQQMWTNVAPSARRLIRPTTVVDPLREAGRLLVQRADEVGSKLDAWAERFYNNDALLNDQRRFMLGGKIINPAAVSEMTEVVRVGDLTSLAFHSFIDGGMGALIKGVNAQGHVELAYDDLRTVIKAMVDTDFDRLIQMPGYEHFGSSKAMAEVARVIKAHGQSVLDQFESLIPHQSMGDLIPSGIFPTPTDGRWTKTDLKTVDRIINNQANPVGWSKMSPADKQALADFRESYKDLWNTNIRGKYLVNNEWQATDPALFDALRTRARTVEQARADRDLLQRTLEDYKLNTHPGTIGRRRTAAETAEIQRLDVEAKRKGRELQEAIRQHANAQAEVRAGDGLHIFDSIDSEIFKHDPNQYVDLPKFADHLGSAFGQAHATAIGFDPNSLPLGMRSAMWFKGQLSPLWMTLWPQYHINNLAGNWMAQLVGAIRGDMHVRAIPGKNGRVMEQRARLGSGWGAHAYERTDFAHNATEAGRYRQAAQIERGTPTRAVPQFLDYVTGGFRGEGKRGAVTLSADAANAVEDYFKTSNMTNAQAWHFTHRYSAELRDLERAKVLTAEQRATLGPLMGIDEMRAAATSMGLTAEATEKVLAAGRASIANSSLAAYTETKNMLRDYRYRNKIDGMLDRFLPVHYWSTKNFAFMTRSAIDRPFVTLAAAKAYNAWQQENMHLPISLRTGYLAVPFDHPALSWIPGVTNKTWHMRLTNLTNPVLWSVPRMLGRWDWHGEDQSIWSRVAHVSMDGAKNFWESSGYRVGPLYDMGTVLGNAWRTTGLPVVQKHTGSAIPDNGWTRAASALLDGANFLTSPGLDRNLNVTEGYRPGVLNSIPGFGDLGYLPMRSHARADARGVSEQSGLRLGLHHQ